MENRSKNSTSVIITPAKYYAGIFLTSSAVLLFEVALTRVFAVMLWAHMAFMVVGTALFGFGLSGVYLALKGNATPESSERKLPILCLWMMFFMLVAYTVINLVPFEIWKVEDSIQIIYLGIWYISLVIPFFFAGLIVARLLSGFPKRSARLYGFDLLGAAAGSLLFVPVINRFGGEGAVFFAALLAVIAAFSFSRANRYFVNLIAVICLITLGIVVPRAGELFPLAQHQSKRGFDQQVESNQIIATKWSPISRVDLAPYAANYIKVWIDGGTNDSVFPAWNGDIGTLKPQNWLSVGNIYNLKAGTNPNVMIIGSAGGVEVLFAISHGAKHVDAVEMDPSIVSFAQSESIRKFTGNLFDNEKVTLVNDEGRSYLKRQPTNYYDVIQFVNNYTPVAIGAGALNLSETYLLTTESFHDFLNHLTDQGVIALHRGATLRVAITAMEALRERGISNPKDHIVITYGERPYFEGLFIKKTPWTIEEVRKLNVFMRDKQRVAADIFAWNPYEPKKNNIYSKIINMSVEEQTRHYTSLGVNLFPATDDLPFMEHFLQIGKRQLSLELPKEFRQWNDEKWRGIIPRGDFPYVAILFESALLALIFIGLPLYRRARHALNAEGFWNYMAFYSSLGFGFIVVEICLMKRYALFLGNPAYSLTTILVALLLAAGIGSLITEHICRKNPAKALNYVIPGIAVALLIEMFLFPVVTSNFLHLSFLGRICVSCLMLTPVGILMGMPFALGMRIIDVLHTDPDENRRLVAWAWGMNAYATVIGSAATVFLALYLGFKAALLVAIAAYLLGYIMMYIRGKAIKSA